MPFGSQSADGAEPETPKRDMNKSAAVLAGFQIPRLVLNSSEYAVSKAAVRLFQIATQLSTVQDRMLILPPAKEEM